MDVDEARKRLEVELSEAVEEMEDETGLAPAVLIFSTSRNKYILRLIGKLGGPERTGQ